MAALKALVVAHDHVSPAGPVGSQLEARGYQLEAHHVVPAEAFHRPAVRAAFPDFTAFDAVVLMGAPWSLYDHDSVGSWVGAEIAQLREADSAGVPVLGICFGGQLLAAAHGGTVQASPKPEIGWYEVSSRAPSIVPAGPWFQWHYDTWQLPPGAIELAVNDNASQAFRVGRNLAVQFHPELTASSLAGWLGHGGEAKAADHGLDPQDLFEETRRLESGSAARARALVDGFLDTVAPSDRSATCLTAESTAAQARPAG